MASGGSATEGFWSSLGSGPLSSSELELLGALLALGQKARDVLPQGVSIQEWAERRVPPDQIAEVNRSGIVFIPSSAPAAPPAARTALPEPWPEPAPAVPELGASVRQSVVKSLVQGVKSWGAGLLGVVLRPLRMPEQPKLEVPDNTFYFDPMTKRWRQHGVDDVDVSNIDPNTGRTIQQDHQMLGPPPMSQTSGCLMQSQKAHPCSGSLYVDPLKPSQPGQPVKPLEPQPVKPMHPVEPAQHLQPTMPQAQPQQPQPLESAQLLQPLESAQMLQPSVQPVAQPVAQPEVDFIPCSEHATLVPQEALNSQGAPKGIALAGPGDGSLLRGTARKA